ncbi:hypothetical protein [Streptomyces sp. NPDC008121]|uniref:hypothetical protein n=1 Tax=Streptomyces sp. NPDC008121 TaxID=3364809 RepID=UPI0036E78F4C
MVLEEAEVADLSAAPGVSAGGGAELGGGESARKGGEPLEFDVARVLDGVEVGAGVLLVEAVAFGSAELVPGQAMLALSTMARSLLSFTWRFRQMM